MKVKKKIIIFILVFVLILSCITGLFLYFHNPNKLNTEERQFLANNATTVQNISVLNNADIFGVAGEGLFYDFLNDFSENYDIEMNTVAYNLGEVENGLSFGASNTISDTDLTFYKDHYVLVSKSYEYLPSIDSLEAKKIGILNENFSYVTNYLGDQNPIVLTTYDNDETLLEAFNNQNDIQYMIVPMHMYLQTILKNNFAISYHFSDMFYYYKLNVGNDVLGSILKKYYNTWKEESFNTYYEEHLFQLFINSLNISSAEVDAMRSISYHYGFVYNSPYEVLSGGNYGGIIAQYLKEFTDFSDTEIKFTKYKNVNHLAKAIQKKKEDMYFAYYNINNTYQTVLSGLGMNYYVLANKKDDLVLNSLNGINSQDVYVENNTEIYNYLKVNTKLHLKTYDNVKELEKLIKKNKIIIADEKVYLANANSLFSTYNVRFKNFIKKDYAIRMNTNATFTKLFNAFIQYKDASITTYKGIYNFEKTLKNGTVTGTIARYFMYILIIGVFLFLYIYRFTKRVKISKKIKKEDKLKYMDQLTSLKNRNYLSENLESWAKNTVYPQTIIVIDLNNLQNINDTMGYEQGDIQIKAAANILVKTQLDNSEIIRTDGNEFVIYLVGYQQKQITSYIHKLAKEFKKMPYEYGAAIGYSMIVDDIKSVEDAMNEAVEDVKKQKHNKKEVN